MSRFDYVKYDDKATRQQGKFKVVFQTLDNHIDGELESGRAKSLALTKAEECYMWIGKAIRDDQIERNGSAELEEGRSDS